MILLDVKNYVARQRNQTNGSSPDSIRDGLINDAFREYRNFKQWTWLDTPTTLTITNNEASLPDNYNLKWQPLKIYADDGTELTKKPINQLDNFSNSYYLDKSNKKIVFNTSYTSLTLIYTKTILDYALDCSNDLMELPEPDIDPVKYLSLSMHWMSQERATGKQQLYYDLYTQSRNLNVSQDKREIKTPKHPYADIAAGFNVN